MAIIKSGSDDTLLELDISHLAIKATYVGGEVVGTYRRSLQSGTIAARTAAGVIFTFWNGSFTPANKRCLIHDISIGFRTVAANTAATQVISLWRGSGMVALETTNVSTLPSMKGQALTPKSRQMAGQMVICSTAMATGATGGTDDSQPLASMVVSHPGTISAIPIRSFFSYHSNLGFHTYPIYLAGDNYIRIRADTAFPGGTDTSVAIVTVEWSEIIYS